MSEHRKVPLLPREAFLARLALSAGLGFLMIVISLSIGMAGYHYFENLPWIDAFANAAMILSGMGPLGTLQTNSGKLFAGFYALFSGLVFIVIIGLTFAPVVHRFLHKFHMEIDSNK
jgi:cytochrome c biogenesis protein CcdA